MSKAANKGKSGGGSAADKPKQDSGGFFSGLLEGFVGRLAGGESQSRNPADPAARMQPVHEERKEAGEEAIFRATEGADGRAPMERVQRQRQYVARAISGRAGSTKPRIPKGSGGPLPGAVRSRMEPRLGADLSEVRVHTSGESAEAAQGFGAKAFTVGSDVHFNAGEFQPGTKEGDKLIAHELTHVVQGQKSGVQRKAEEDGDEKGEEGGAEVSDPSEPAEKEADDIGEKVGEELNAGDEKKDGEKADKKEGGEKGGDAAGAEAPAAPISRQIRRKVFRVNTPSNPPPGGPSPQEQQADTAWTPVKDRDVKDGDLARVLGQLVPQIDGWANANPQSTKLKEIQNQIKAKVEAAFKACSDDVKAVNDELTDAVDKKESAEKLLTDDRWVKWATHALLGLARVQQHPRLSDVFSHIERSRSGTPEATETLVPACEYSGRAVIFMSGAAWYQSSGQANNVPGSLYKQQGSWLKIYGVQTVPTQATNAQLKAMVKPGWIIKTTGTAPSEVNAPAMPNVVFKPEGPVADLNAWIQGKGGQAVTNFDDTLPDDMRATFGLPPKPRRP